MTEPIDFGAHVRDEPVSVEDRDFGERSTPVGVPSNEVYARVGDIILRAARDGVRRGLTPQDIIREILAEHGVHLNVGELRLLLAARRVPKKSEPA
jgi:hypothetical protein